MARKRPRDIMVCRTGREKSAPLTPIWDEPRARKCSWRITIIIISILRTIIIIIVIVIIHIILVVVVVVVVVVVIIIIITSDTYMGRASSPA